MKLHRVTALLLVLMALVGPLAIAQDPQRADVNRIGQPLSWVHPLGTDHAGRDILARVVYGARYTLLLLALSGLTACSLGIGLGIGAGFSEGVKQRFLNHVITSLLAFPPLLLALLILTVMERHLLILAFVSGAVQAPALGAAVAAQVRHTRHSSYWQSSIASGADWRYLVRFVVMRDLIPYMRLLGPITAAYSFLTASTLSYLGLTGDPALPEWGTMLAEARSFLHLYPLTAMMPGALILITMLTLQGWAKSPK